MILPVGSLAIEVSQLQFQDRGDKGRTPDSPVRAIVREQMPDHASQKRISWSYEPVTRMTDMSGVGGLADGMIKEGEQKVIIPGV